MIVFEKPIIECAAVFSPGQQYKIRTTCSQFPEAQRPNCRMDTQVDLSGAKKGISPGASGWHDGGGSSCTARLPVCSCQSFIAVSGIFDVILKRSPAASDGPSACAVCLWAGGWRTGCTADAADAGLCAIWESRFSEQLCRKRVRDAQMDWLQRGRDGRRLGTAGRRAGLYYKIRRSLSPGTELSLFESVHPPCRPGGNNSRLYTMQRMCWQGTVRKSADLCDGRRKQIS